MQWIKVKDQLPKLGVANPCLFVNGKKEVTYGYAYDPKEGWDTGHEELIWINDYDRQTNEVARYWMPLPKPPDEAVSPVASD